MRLAPKNEHQNYYLRVDVFIFWSYPHDLSLSLSLSLSIYIYIYILPLFTFKLKRKTKVPFQIFHSQKYYVFNKLHIKLQLHVACTDTFILNPITHPFFVIKTYKILTNIWFKSLHPQLLDNKKIIYIYIYILQEMLAKLLIIFFVNPLNLFGGMHSWKRMQPFI